MRVLITNIASVTGISITKILRTGEIQNLEIIGTEAQKYGYNSGSLLVDKYIQVPEISDTNYVKTIIDICKDWRVDIIIPILDEELYLFSQAKIQNYVNILLPSIDTINLFRDKLAASMKLNLIYPEIIPPIYKSINDLRGDKVIIRKRKSIGSQGIIIKKEAEITYEDFKNRSYFVQKYVKGDEYTVDILADKYGNSKLIIPRKRLQIKNGVSTKVLLEDDREIIDLCKKIYAQFCIPGLSNAQFIRSNGRLYFIELNLRFAGMGIASILGSYDFISKYILYLNEGKTLGCFSKNMKRVKWNSVICRYYEETILMQ